MLYIHIHSPKLIYGTWGIHSLWENPYLCYHNHSSVPIIFLPLSIHSDTLDSCLHIHKEDPSSLLLVFREIWSKSCPLCLVLRAKACQDRNSWAVSRRCNKSIIHLWQIKTGPNSETHLVLPITTNGIPQPKVAQKQTEPESFWKK